MSNIYRCTIELKSNTKFILIQLHNLAEAINAEYSNTKKHFKNSSPFISCDMYSKNIPIPDFLFNLVNSSNLLGANDEIILYIYNSTSMVQYKYIIDKNRKEEIEVLYPDFGDDVDDEEVKTEDIDDLK